MVSRWGVDSKGDVVDGTPVIKPCAPSNSEHCPAVPQHESNTVF